MKERRKRKIQLTATEKCLHTAQFTYRERAKKKKTF
jgi:hypothetical protein